VSTSRRAAALALLLVGCAQPPADQAWAWATEAMLAAPGKSFAGFDTSRLTVKQGAMVPWRTAEYGVSPPDLAATDAVVVQPAWSEGAPAAYLVTEIWENHPDPWVQPVYHFVKPYDATAPAAHRTGADGVFGVGVESTFYSPYWRLWWVEPGDAVGPYTSVAQIAAFPMHKGPMVVCPIVPPDVTPSGTTHPFTGEPLQAVGIGHAYVDGTRTDYFDFGANRQDVNVYEDVDGTVSPAHLYTFASLAADGTRTLLELPAVLPEDATHHAFVRRVDVVLDSQAVFVPASLPELRSRLRSQVDVPDADPAIPAAVARRYLLRVAKDGACFASAASFPAGCAWLDSEAALEAAIASNRLLETQVTLTATAVMLP
jgi:hypothetical protein